MNKKGRNGSGFFVAILLLSMVGITTYMLFNAGILEFTELPSAAAAVPTCNPAYQQKYNTCVSDLENYEKALDEANSKINSYNLDTKVFPITIFIITICLAIFAAVAFTSNLFLLKKINERQDKFLEEKEKFDIEKRRWTSTHSLTEVKKEEDGFENN